MRWVVFCLAPRVLLLARRFLLRKECCGLVANSPPPNEPWLIGGVQNLFRGYGG